MAKLTFEDVVKYAELCECEHRDEFSRATDYTGKFFHNHWIHQNMMVLYEAPRRVLKGHDKPEVCWWCIAEDGGIRNIPSRHLRMMDEKKGFVLYDKAYEMIEKALNGVDDEPFWGI